MDIFYFTALLCFLGIVSARPREELVEYLTEFTAQCPIGTKPQILTRRNDFFKVKITGNSLNKDPTNAIYGTNRQAVMGSYSCYIIKAKMPGLMLEFCGTAKNTEGGTFNFVQDDGNVISVPANNVPLTVRNSICVAAWSQFEGLPNLRSIKICTNGQKAAGAAFVKLSDIFVAMCV